MDKVTSRVKAVQLDVDLEQDTLTTQKVSRATGFNERSVKSFQRSYDRISWVMKTVYEMAKHTRQIANMATM
jgi:hypothetical protein